MPPAPQPTLPLNADFGPYHLLKLVAVGGMAEVYLARAKGVAGFEKVLALKVIHRDLAADRRFVQMLINEAKLAVQLNHTNVSQTFDLGCIDDVYYISMEYVDGADYFRILKGITDRDAEVPLALAIAVTREMCAGLSYAHKKTDGQGQPLHIIHRDISPQNVLLSRHGDVKLVDFGIAKAANLSSKTRAGVLKGKLVYMSPEQAAREKIDQRSDIFSAGIVLYESLTGGSLYADEQPAKLIERVRKAEIPVPSRIRPEIPPELDALTMHALSRDPNERFQTAGDFGDALAQQLRLNAPGYGSRQIGEIVKAIVDDLPLPGPATVQRRLRPAASEADPVTMDRNDYQVPGHSVIYGSPSSELQSPDLVANIILSEGSSERCYPIGQHFIIGRGGDLRLGDARVSRQHAQIVLHNNQHMIEDLNSANGTFLNEQRVRELQELHDGDQVRIGPYSMHFALRRPVANQDQFIYSNSDRDDLTPRIAVVPEPHMPAAEHALAQLTFQLGSEEVRLPLHDGLPLSYTLSLGSLQVTRGTAAVVTRDNVFWLQPGDEATSLHLNGEPLRQSAQLKPGDVITLGPLELSFRAE